MSEAARSHISDHRQGAAHELQVTYRAPLRMNNRDLGYEYDELLHLLATSSNDQFNLKMDRLTS